jgi:cytochrome P450
MRTAQAAWVVMQVASQINTFLLAGYETTASALAFTVYHVARNPDKEAKLLAEIDAFGRSRAPTLEDLDQVGNRSPATAALCTCSPVTQSASKVRGNQQPADAMWKLM